MYQHLLVPLDDTPLGAELIGEAVDLARSLGARITFLHVTGGQEGSLYGDAEVLRATEPAKYAEKFQWAARSVLSRAEMAARAALVKCASTTVANPGALHDAILSTAEQVRADLIVMASHERSSRLAALVGSNAVAVMTRTRTPFLLAVPGVAGPMSMRRALARLRDEHRSIAAVVEGMRRIAAGPAVSGLTDGRRVLQASLQFLDAFAAAQHHPKEEQYLFAKCRARGDEMEALLDELEQQHLVEDELLDGVSQALGGEAAQLQAAVEELAGHVWRHMAQEEQLVLPFARVTLNEQDWLELDLAFAGHTDPRFGADTEQDLHAMYARLVNLFPK